MKTQLDIVISAYKRMLQKQGTSPLLKELA